MRSLHEWRANINVYLSIYYSITAIGQWNFRASLNLIASIIIIASLIALGYAQPRARRRRNATRNRYDLITRAIHPLSPGDDESSLARESRGKPSILCPMWNRFLLRERARRGSTDAECFLTRHFNRKWPGRKGVGRSLRAPGTVPSFSAQPSSPPRRDS